MGRKKQQVKYRPANVAPKIFTCPSCGKKTMRAKIKSKDTEAIVKCGSCGLEQVVEKNSLTEPVDAFGDFIDIYYRDTEYERLTLREEKLLEKEQYTEVTLVYSFLEDIAKINEEKATQDFNETKNPEAEETAEKWHDAALQYKANREKLQEQLDNNQIVDAELDEIYDEEDDLTSYSDEKGQDVDKKKAKKGTDIEDLLGDTGFLEW